MIFIQYFTSTERKSILQIICGISLIFFALQPLSIHASTATTATEEGASRSSNACITFDSADRIITISCDSARLSDIYTQINDPEILMKESGSTTSSGTVWVLDAGINIDEGSTLIIDSKDTKWLKIIADGTTAHRIEVLGSLKIDSVKITGWNPKTNDYALSKDSQRIGEETVIGTPRPYIQVAEEATGTTDITNSEIAYLGYEGGWGSGTSGLRYGGGDGSKIIGNNIHNLWFAFYSVGVGNMVIENNHIHDHGYYALDPHTGTHDMIIRNNTIHDAGSTGIICSLDCYNILIEGNEVYNTEGSGITLSRNVQDSVVRNNDVHDITRCISVSASHNNEVYGNTVANCKNGLYLLAGSSNNKVYDNTVSDSQKGILINTDAAANTISSNTVINATEEGISIDTDAGDNTIENNNKLINSPSVSD